MSAYERDDERAMQTGRLVDDWTQSRLLTPEQRDVVMPQLVVDLRRTNKFLRFTLFIFGAVILHSTLGLLAVVMGNLDNEAIVGVLCLLIGGACFWLARELVRRYRFYRFGVEEAVALTAAAMVTGGAALLVADHGDWPAVFGLVAAVAMLTTLYVYFGYVYAAVMALGAAAALPFQIGSPTALGAGDAQVVQRAMAVVVLAAIAATVRKARSEHGDEHPGDSLAVIEAAAWLGIYLLVNLVVSSGFLSLDRDSLVHWASYIGIWILPAIGLWLSLRGRERPLLWASMAMALGTLLSNKAYLGSPRHEWDPILFGLLLIGIAIGVRRWLAAGPEGMRHGYTSARLVASDQELIGTLATVSTAQVDVPVTPAASAPDIGGGGRSGGAGAGGSF